MGSGPVAHRDGTLRGPECGAPGGSGLAVESIPPGRANPAPTSLVTGQSLSSHYPVTNQSLTQSPTQSLTPDNT